MTNGIHRLTQEQRLRYDLLSERYYVLIRRGEGDFPARLLDYKARVHGRYANARDYALYSLISETPHLMGVGPFDFPEPDSLERFINGEYTRAFPEQVLFSLLSDSKNPVGLPGVPLPMEVKRFLDTAYEPTVADTLPVPGRKKRGAVPGSGTPGLPLDKEAGRMKWLEEPLSLQPSPALAYQAKTTVFQGAQPFSAKVEKPAPPPSPPQTGLKRWLKGCWRENHGR